MENVLAVASGLTAIDDVSDDNLTFPLMLEMMIMKSQIHTHQRRWTDYEHRLLQSRR